jgi:hypothetical protein
VDWIANALLVNFISEISPAAVGAVPPLVAHPRGGQQVAMERLDYIVALTGLLPRAHALSHAHVDWIANALLANFASEISFVECS